MSYDPIPEDVRAAWRAFLDSIPEGWRLSGAGIHLEAPRGFLDPSECDKPAPSHSLGLARMDWPRNDGSLNYRASDVRVYCWVPMPSASDRAAELRRQADELEGTNR